MSVVERLPDQVIPVQGQKMTWKSGGYRSCPCSQPPLIRGGRRVADQQQNMFMEELAEFHTTLCTSRKSPDLPCEYGECCPHSHCVSWKRRNPFHHPYRPNLCPNVQFWTEGGRMRVKSHCRRGRGCMFSHTKEEQMYHPLVYKTQLCRDWPDCSKHYCPFAHGSEELRDPQLVDFSPIQGPEIQAVPPSAMTGINGDTSNSRHNNSNRQRSSQKSGNREQLAKPPPRGPGNAYTVQLAERNAPRADTSHVLFAHLFGRTPNATLQSTHTYPSPDLQQQARALRPPFVPRVDRRMDCETEDMPQIPPQQQKGCGDCAVCHQTLIAERQQRMTFERATGSFASLAEDPSASSFRESVGVQQLGRSITGAISPPSSAVHRCSCGCTLESGAASLNLAGPIAVGSLGGSLSTSLGGSTVCGSIGGSLPASMRGSLADRQTFVGSFEDNPAIFEGAAHPDLMRAKAIYPQAQSNRGRGGQQAAWAAQQQILEADNRAATALINELTSVAMAQASGSKADPRNFLEEVSGIYTKVLCGQQHRQHPQHPHQAVLDSLNQQNGQRIGTSYPHQHPPQLSTEELLRLHSAAILPPTPSATTTSSIKFGPSGSFSPGQTSVPGGASRRQSLDSHTLPALRDEADSVFSTSPANDTGVLNAALREIMLLANNAGARLRRVQ